MPAVLTDLAHDASESGGYDYGAAWTSLYDGSNEGRLSGLAVTLSLVPFSSPIAMPVRWVAGNLPTYELALSLGILAVSIVAVTWIAARIYRVGILMTGKRPNLRELVRWVRA